MLFRSYFGRAQYSFKDKYLFTFTARIDGSDRFGKNNRYAFFPSGAFAWRMNQEDFLKDVNWLSDAKLRVSMGQVGNENLPNTMLLPSTLPLTAEIIICEIQKREE